MESEGERSREMEVRSTKSNMQPVEVLGKKRAHIRLRNDDDATMMITETEMFVD